MEAPPTAVKYSRILLAEDSTPDAKLLMSLFQENGFLGEFIWCTDGEMVLNTLFRRSSDEMLPQLILLDIGLPKYNGHEILSRLKGDARCARIPVIMLSSSSQPSEIMSTLERGVVSYYSKPADLRGFEILVERLLREDLPRLGLDTSQRLSVNS